MGGGPSRLGRAAPAARRGYGAAVDPGDLVAEPRLGEAIDQILLSIVPVYELKWATLPPDPRKV